MDGVSCLVLPLPNPVCLLRILLTTCIILPFCFNEKRCFNNQLYTISIPGGFHDCDQQISDHNVGLLEIVLFEIVLHRYSYTFSLWIKSFF